MPTILVEVECPRCGRRIDVQVYAATARAAAGPAAVEVYERCPKCGQTFPFLVPADLG
mgnify:CR=1 FL=1